MLKWDEIQQVLRIGLYTAAGFTLGQGVTEEELFQQAVAGVLAIATFVWWLFWERQAGRSARGLR